MAFSSTLVKTGVEGDMSYAIFTYVATGVSTGAITTNKGILHVDWTPYTIRAGSSIDFKTTDGTITLAGLTSGDTGEVKVYYKAGF